MFYQCEMTRDGAKTIGWIDERGAKVGYEVELLTGDGKFWRVTKVFHPGMTEQALHTKQRNDRNSLPSLVGAKG